MVAAGRADQPAYSNPRERGFDDLQLAVQLYYRYDNPACLH
jgi:hypothetical protein